MNDNMEIRLDIVFIVSFLPDKTIKLTDSCDLGRHPKKIFTSTI